MLPFVTPIGPVQPKAQSSQTVGSAASFWRKDLEGCTVAIADDKGIWDIDGHRYRGSQAVPLGSVTKTITGLLVLQLIELKKLNLGTKLSSLGFGYLPEAGQVTIRELLSHTSGYPEYFYGVDPASAASKDRILAMIRKACQRGVSGRGKFHYANTNFALLGFICEKVTGKPYGELVNTYVNRPLGISLHPARLVTFDLNWYGGAGCLECSLRDLATFSLAISRRDIRLLSSGGWRVFNSPTTDMGQQGSKYGAGAILAELSVYSVLTHGGGIPANAGQPTYTSIYVAGPPSNPLSLAASSRKELTPKVLNALYGAFSGVNAADETCRWLERFCSSGSIQQIGKWTAQGKIGPELARLLTPQALHEISGRLGRLRDLKVIGEMVQPKSAQIVGLAYGTKSTLRVEAVFGPGGTLQSFGFTPAAN